MVLGKKSLDFFNKRKYDQHRYRVENARPTVDNKSPKKYPHISKKPHRTIEIMKRLNENAALLRRYTRVLRNRPNPAFFNETFKLARSKVPAMIKRMRAIEKENVKMGLRLLKVKPVVQTNLKKLTNSHNARYAVPKNVLKLYEIFVAPEKRCILPELMRPRIYFELEIKGIFFPLRIVIQLFIEACPEVVLEFVQLCFKKDTDKFRVWRVFPELWMDAGFKLYDKELKKPRFYDRNVFPSHTNTGVLSLPKRCYEGGFTNGYLSFNIHFKPLSKQVYECLQFGVVTQGLRWLSFIQDFGTKHGAIKKDITLKKCGFMND